MANNIGAVCSGSTMFASILKGDSNLDDYYVLYEISYKTMNFDISFI